MNSRVVSCIYEFVFVIIGHRFPKTYASIYVLGPIYEPESSSILSHIHGLTIALEFVSNMISFHSPTTKLESTSILISPLSSVLHKSTPSRPILVYQKKGNLDLLQKQLQLHDPRIIIKNNFSIGDY